MTYREAVGEAPRSSPWFSSGEDFDPADEDEMEVVRLVSQTHATERIRELERQVEALRAELAQQSGNGQPLDRGSWGLIETITADQAGLRACLFRDAAGTYSFDLQRHEISDDRHMERWVRAHTDVPDSFRHGIGDWAEALTRAGNALAGMVEVATTIVTGDGQRVAVGAPVWVHVFGRDLMFGTLFAFDAETATVDVRGMGGVIKRHAEVYAVEEAANQKEEQ